MRPQIKSPKTNRLIYVGGDAYNKLMDEYTKEEIALLPVINPYHQADLTGVNDTDAFLIKYLDGEDLLNACMINKRINALCLSDDVLKNRINDYIKINKLKFNTMKYRIARAILSANEKKGTSLSTIKKYLEANFKMDSTDQWINFTIYILTNTSGDEKLIINKNHRGHYKLSPALVKYVNDYKKHINKK